MAENKKSFVLYCDIISTVRKLNNEQAGELFKVILSYVNDENPVINNIIIDLVFEPIKLQLKRDLVRYEDKKIKWSEAGKKSAETNKRQQSLTNVDNRQQMSTDTVTVTDNVNVTVINNPLPLEGEFLKTLPFGWNDLIKVWLDYKAKKRQKYKDMNQLEVMYQKLVKLSDNDLVSARDIIENSIAFNYSGFFKQNSNQNGTNKRNNKGIDIDGIVNAVFDANGVQ